MWRIPEPKVNARFHHRDLVGARLTIDVHVQTGNILDITVLEMITNKKSLLRSNGITHLTIQCIAKALPCIDLLIT